VHRRPAMVSRALLALPAAGSLVAAALVWKLLDRSVGWLDHPATALVGVAVVAAWVQIGYQVPVFLAGLDRIPASYHDAARVDGAGAWQHFRWVTFPLLRPVVLFALVTGTIVAAQAFTLVFILTGGGPAGATDLIAYRIYRTAWVDGRFDVASVLAILLAGVLLALTWSQFRLLDRRVEHA
jgi:multiple sugar transport system permease protein